MTMRPERSTRSAPAFSWASGQPRPHVRDDAVFDEYVRVQDVPRGVHGDDGCVGEQCAHVFSPVVDRGVTLWLAGLMSGGGGCPRQELRLPPRIRRTAPLPQKIPAGGECGRGREDARGPHPHTMPYRVITECAFRCHAGRARPFPVLAF